MMINSVKIIALEHKDVQAESAIADVLVQKTGDYLKPPIYLLVYKHHEIQIGMIDNGQIVLERQEELTRDYLKELRVFSEQGELHIWKQQGKFKYRLRVEEEKGNITVYDETNVMWGLEPNKADNRVIEEPGRGMSLQLPFSVTKTQLPLKYTVRNYFDYDDNGLIRFNDARLVQFLDYAGQSLPK